MSTSERTKALIERAEYEVGLRRLMSESWGMETKNRQAATDRRALVADRARRRLERDHKQVGEDSPTPEQYLVAENLECGKDMELKGFIGDEQFGRDLTKMYAAMLTAEWMLRLLGVLSDVVAKLDALPARIAEELFPTPFGEPPSPPEQPF